MEILSFIAFLTGVIGVVVILIGVVHALMMLVKYWLSKRHTHQGEHSRLDKVRLYLGRYIILGLEFMIAKDVIETLIVPTWSEVGILAILVVIRSMLSYFLTREIDQIEVRKIEHRKIDAGIK